MLSAFGQLLGDLARAPPAADFCLKQADDGGLTSNDDGVRKINAFF